MTAPRFALILDTETTGLCPKAGDVCLEVGCILYDLVEGESLESYAALIRSTHDNIAYGVNGISRAMLESASDATMVWPRVRWLAGRADVILAHRAEFDQSFVPGDLRSSLPWVCTKTHVSWPKGKPGDHLVQLALAHGVGLLDAHRAITDCQTLARILTRCRDAYLVDLVKLIEHAMRPRTRVISLAPFQDKEKVKAHGFLWDSEKRVWWKDAADDEIAMMPFKTREMPA